MTFAFNARTGPLFIDGEITGPARSIAVRLILDTGATTSLINKRVLTAIASDASVQMADRVANDSPISASRSTAITRR